MPDVHKGRELVRKRFLIPDTLSVSLSRDMGSIQSPHSLTWCAGQVWIMPRRADKLWGVWRGACHKEAAQQLASQQMDR